MKRIDHQGLTQEEVEKLLTHTTSCINHIYHFEQNLGLRTSSSQRGTAIAFTDLKERRHDFLRELVNTVCSWVYNKEKAKELFANRLAEVGGDSGNASAFLVQAANQKFRPGHPQGQFGELLLFNFIQHFFKAAPMLRKQRITTSTGHERFGADAIHYRRSDTNNILYLGESKCYERQYRFNVAFKEAVESIMNTHSNLDRELGLYLHEDFIEKELQEVAAAYKSNTLANVRIELVCLIAYEENKSRSKTDQHSIEKSINAIVEERCSQVPAANYGNFSQPELDRIHYVIFPIWDLEALLGNFQSIVGGP